MNQLKIILSPAKKMNTDDFGIPPQSIPVFLKQTQEILTTLQDMSYEELKKLWACNDKIAKQNYTRIKEMNLERGLIPAILSYDGIAFQYMAPSVFENGEFSYVQEHLRILSGFYGMLKPMDGVTPYRLEMQSKLKTGGKKDLYAYWGNLLYQEVTCESKQRAVIINLASKEYSKCIEPYLKPEDTYITCIFGELEKGKIVQKGVYAKMARGEMVRFMAEHQITEIEEIRKFNRLDYNYRAEYSDEKTYVFLR